VTPLLAGQATAVRRMLSCIQRAASRCACKPSRCQ